MHVQLNKEFKESDNKLLSALVKESCPHKLLQDGMEELNTWTNMIDREVTELKGQLTSTVRDLVKFEMRDEISQAIKLNNHLMINLQESEHPPEELKHIAT